MDEFEFEVSATDTGQQRSVRAPRRIPPLRRPPRAVTVGLVVACVVLVTTGLALASVPNLSGRVHVLLHGTPTATPRILPGGNLLYVEGGLASPWGKLTLNGKPVALADLTTSANNGYASALFLQRGTNAIDYRADPFPELRCRLSVPASKGDTCPLDASYPFSSELPKGGPRALNLTPTLDKLPRAARTDLQQVISAYVTIQTPSATVQPGERYVNADHQIVYADQQLTATFVQALATSASPTSQGCAAVCMPTPASDTFPVPSPEPVADFVVDAHLTQGFTYATASGQPIATDAPISATSAVPSDGVVALTATWNGAWRVALNGAWQVVLNGVPQSTSAACLAGAEALTPYLVVDPADNQRYLTTAAEIPAANPADGCVFRLGGGGYGGPATPDEFIHLFYRFGVVMVVDDAHDVTWAEGDYLLKGLPLTDDAETALAQQIDASQPYS